MLDFRNNLIYNWGQRPGYNDTDKVSMNYVENYLKPGPSTLGSIRYTAFHVNSPTLSMYMDGNMIEGSVNKDWGLVRFTDKSWYRIVRLPVPLIFGSVRTETAVQAKSSVLDGAGAVLPKRDPVDERIVRDVREGRGRIIDSQTQVGGWPKYAPAAQPQDSDMDGMPDEWEKAFGLDPFDAADASSDLDGDGYTNIEEFLNSTNPRVRD